MNNITHTALNNLGYNFIPSEFIPAGENEYYLRNQQNRSGIAYRNLTVGEIAVLERNHNTSDNWNNVLVADFFNPDLVVACKFFGLVRIGNLEDICLSFSDLSIPVGLYNSTIISCDFGHNVVINNVHYMSHYITGNEVMIVNVDELITTNHAKFGNGIVKDNEDESVRIWMEIRNENGGRKVMPFNSMLAGDAWLWSKYRERTNLMGKFHQFTENEFKTAPGFYGKIGDRTIIKNTGIVKDVWIGSDAYIKGANKLKNLTVNSGEEGLTQIGEGCELVNGIVGFGCRIFYGVKAVRFVMGSHAQLKYGARLINSYLGDNATISCCEVLNSLIYPAHEQHHNNSFLIAAVVQGQSNIPAGATIGSNHNSRSADGEILTGRGFWPALCVSLKHNSKFPVFTMIAKGNYSYELNVPIPFSLVSLNESADRIEIMVGYWFLYNMYAITRNTWKYQQRDKRKNKQQFLEFDFLAPDSVNAILHAMQLIETAVGKAFYTAFPTGDKMDFRQKGVQLLSQEDPIIDTLEIILEHVENSKRKTLLTKVSKGHHSFAKMIEYYGLRELYKLIQNDNFSLNDIHDAPMQEWHNVGGQLFSQSQIDTLIAQIEENKITSWDAVHDFYRTAGIEYPNLKKQHAIATYFQQPSTRKDISAKDILDRYIALNQWITDEIEITRAKDYTSEFRKMMYDSPAEMDQVLGAESDNEFIEMKKEELQQLKIDAEKTQQAFARSF